jgi:hypothetical protein
MPAAPNETTPELRELLADWLDAAMQDAERDGLLYASTDDGTVRAVEWAVLASRRSITGDLDRYLLDLRLESMAPADTAGNRRSHVVTLDVVSPHTLPDDLSADEHDRVVSVVLDALTTRRGGFAWTSAVYAVRDDRFPCYRITLNLTERPD